MEKLVHYCVAKMLENKVIEEQQAAVVIYGLDLLFSSVLSMISLLILGWILGKVLFTTVLLITFIPLQSFGGGFHCQTHLRCWSTMFVGYLITIFLLSELSIGILWFLSGVGAYAFLRCAPVENEKAPFSVEFKKKMRKFVIGVYFIALGFAAIFYWLQLELVYPLLCAVILSIVSILTAKGRKAYRRVFKPSGYCSDNG